MSTLVLPRAWKVFPIQNLHRKHGFEHSVMQMISQETILSNVIYKVIISLEG